MGRKSRLKRQRREAMASAAQYKRVEGLGFAMELDGPRIRFETSADPTERAKAIDRIAVWAESVPAEINADIERISSALATYPTASLLAQLTGMMKLGDPETYRESETKHLDIELEYATWLLLQSPGPVGGSGWIDGPQLKALVDDLHNLVKKVLLYHSVRPSKTSGTLDILARKTRIHDIAIRSPGYEHHLVELLRTLFDPFESDLAATYGFTVQEAIAASKAIRDHVNEAIMSLVDEGRRQRRLMPDLLRNGTTDDLVSVGLPEDVSRFLLALPQTTREERAINYLVGRVWNSFHSAMVVDGSTIANRANIDPGAASAFLDSFSLPFGQKRIADNWPSRYEPQYLAPLIRLDEDAYFAHLNTALPWAVRPNLERKLRDAGLWQNYERHRSDTVETEALRLLTAILPGARSFRNLKYSMPDAHGNLVQYELDGLILYDEVLVVVEAKGGSFSAAARRGAPSLEEDLKETLGRAHEQAARATKYLISTDKAVFRTADGEELVLSLSDFPRVIEVAVTLDPISAFVANWAGVLESQDLEASHLRWSVELLHLRIIAEVIEFGPQFVHYVDCLSRVPPGVLDFNDVLDTLGRYFKNGLNFDFELSHPATAGIRLLTHTAAFDDYFLYEIGERQSPARKPTMALDPDTKSMLQALCETAAPGFVERACKELDKWRHSATSYPG